MPAHNHEWSRPDHRSHEQWGERSRSLSTSRRETTEAGSCRCISQTQHTHTLNVSKVLPIYKSHCSPSSQQQGEPTISLKSLNDHQCTKILYTLFPRSYESAEFHQPQSENKAHRTANSAKPKSSLKLPTQKKLHSYIPLSIISTKTEAKNTTQKSSL